MTKCTLAFFIKSLFYSYGCLETARANRFLKRTFFHPGATKCEEQKREAREDYGNLLSSANIIYLEFLFY